MENFEEIFDIGEELEGIEKDYDRYDFPVATFLKDKIYFNIIAAKLIPKNKRLKWRVSLNYIVGAPAEDDDKTAFRITRDVHHKYVSVCFPQKMKQDKKVRCGHYKVYKFGDGFAIKRNERIGEEA